jgi:cytochrome P450
VAAPIKLDDPLFLKNRRASYKTLRETLPFAETELNGEKTVVLTRYRDLDAILRDKRATVQPAQGQFPAYIGKGPAARFYRSSLPSIDAPDHTTLRRIVSPTFSPQFVARTESWVGEIIERRLDEIERKPIIDVVQQLGDTIPVDVACRLLHMPREDGPFLVSKVNDITAILSQAELPPEQMVRADAAAAAFYDYFSTHIEKLQSVPTEDFIGALLGAAKEGLIHPDHACTIMIDVFLASYHTTMVGFSNAINSLAQFPAQRQALAKDPSLALRAWDELLRYDPPVHFRHRYVSEPVTLEGYRIEPGVKIMLALASGNWDERAFERPDEVDFSRTSNRHLAFGGGAHFCLGSQLSRLEGKLFLPGFLRRFPNYRVIEERSLRDYNLTFPHAVSLVIEFLPANSD